MKSFFIILSMLFISQFSYAEIIKIRVTDHICGEIDPFVIGDACLIQGSSEKRNYALIIDMDEYYYSALAEAEVHDVITLDDIYLERRTDNDTINELNDYFNIRYTKFFYYELLFPTDSVISLEKGNVINTFKLSCENQNYYDGSFMYASVKFESILKVIAGDTYTLSTPSFSYVLSMDENMNDIWAKETLSDRKTTFVNLRTYNPRVYLGHIKYDDIFSRDIFGEVDFILPKDALKTTEDEKSFTSYMIMTAMDDHWGGTVDLNCTIRK